MCYESLCIVEPLLSSSSPMDKSWALIPGIWYTGHKWIVDCWPVRSTKWIIIKPMPTILMMLFTVCTFMSVSISWYIMKSLHSEVKWREAPELSIQSGSTAGPFLLHFTHAAYKTEYTHIFSIMVYMLYKLHTTVCKCTMMQAPVDELASIVEGERGLARRGHPYYLDP